MSQHAHEHKHHHDIDFKKAFTVTKEAGSQVKIVGEIPWAEVEGERSGAIKHLGGHVELDGFRKGHVPESILVKHLGEMNIVAEMAERTIAHMYPHILEEHKIDAIGHPKVELTKLAPGNPLGLTITVAVIPEVTLPGYKEIAITLNKNKESKDVTEEEIKKQIEEILRQKQAYDRIQEKAKARAAAKEAGSDTPSEETEAEAVADLAKLPLPELTDVLVQGLGQPGQFTTVDDFKAKVKEHLTIEKARAVDAKHRASITDAIIIGSTIDLPQILIDSEISQMLAQMEEDLRRANMKIEEYLTHIKKTIEDLKADWTPAAEKRAKLQLILNEIAKREKIEADKDKAAEQIKDILTQYKDADPYRVTVYVTTVLQNEAVMEMLESLS